MKTIPQREEEILKFWQERHIFEKSVQKPSPKGSFVFFDGPPFATGTPHYGHIVASLMKDAVPRYQTMQGYTVPRRWGWDCHGLPIENIVEEELGSKSKQDIERKVGVAAFNENCRSKVLRYADLWKTFIPRMGRWVDMDNPYQTMDVAYMETVWWTFKQLWDKGLIYEGHKAMHICPRCETTLSQSEVTQGYRDITDISAIVTFPLVNQPNTSLLAWTTTPWTLPGNVALAVGEDTIYAEITLCHPEQSEGSRRSVSRDSSATPQNDKHFIVAKETIEKIFGDSKYTILKEFKGSDLVGKAYRPLFTSPQPSPSQGEGVGAFRVYPADFVTTSEGTGIVHIAPAFGADDLALGKEHNLPWVQHVRPNGTIKAEVKEFEGLHVKPTENPRATDQKIVAWLKEHGRLFSSSDYTHSYPHCWRCDTPLLNYATSSLFINVTKLKPRMLALAKGIAWVPTHIKEGRFGKWLEGAQDWSISRQRFWGSVIPIWKCDACKKQVIVGSIAELKQLSGKNVDDLHKHVVDEITFPCTACSSTMKRIPDVLDCWFESAVMPWATQSKVPADFVAEGVDQTRCWFYYMLVASCALEDKIPFKNVIANGIVLAEDGQKMSKHLKNYPDPTAVIEKYGADALRYYLLTSPVMKAESLQFSEQGVKEVYQKVVMILTNVVSFYKMYEVTSPQPLNEHIDLLGPLQGEGAGEVAHPLDVWILSRLHGLTATITKHMETYDLVEATRPMAPFVDDLSTWYIRRSRDRFKTGDPSALQTTHYVLLTLSQLLAPFMPFISEWIWQELQRPQSVHLSEWPKVDEKLVNAPLEEQMLLVRKICELGHALREEAGIKVRQPLQTLLISGSPTSKEVGLRNIELLAIIAHELNIKKITEGTTPTQEGWLIKSDGTLTVSLYTELTPELKIEGMVRELIRTVNGMRKDTGLTIKDTISITLDTSDEIIRKPLESFLEDIKSQTLAKSITWGKVEETSGKRVEHISVMIQKL